MLLAYLAMVVGAVLFFTGLVVDNRWLLAPGLVLVPASIVWGLVRR